MDTITITFKHNDPIWYFETPNVEPVPAIFIKASRRGIVVELAGNRQQQCSYANITRREVIEI